MRRARPSRPLHRTLAGIALAALLLSGCIAGSEGGSDGGSASSDSAASDGGSGDGTGDGTADERALAETGVSAAVLDVDPAEDAAYAAYYDQDIVWTGCDEEAQALATTSVQCASITVPVQWDDPTAGDMDIAILRVAASGGASEGSLLVNPGGPGVSGVDFVAQVGALYFGADVRSSYDIIGFDPRGVSRSAGIRCLSDAETDEYRADTYDATTAEGMQTSIDWMARIADACEENSGDVLPYLDSLSAARDMDVLRAALGDDALHYLGFSYGTYLGSLYADTYPERVGRMVLDGVLDPSIDLNEFGAGQAAGFQETAVAFGEYCLAQDSCPFDGPTGEDAAAQLTAFLDGIAEDPLPTGDPDRPLTGSLAVTGMRFFMYADENWPYALDALNAAVAGDGSTLLRYADAADGRNDDGTYANNALYAVNAINCLDHPGVADRDWQLEETQRLLEEYPDAGFSAYAQALCDQFPFQPVRDPAPVTASGSDLIVVVGTTHDPATPYAWSVSLDEQLENSTLITADGYGHTAYGRNGGCVENAVDAYLVDRTAPEEGLTC
ncbi:alpha/beta hydrolase [Brachybacterium sp. DNPG3]